MFGWLLNLFSGEKVIEKNTFFDIIEKRIKNDFTEEETVVKKIHLKNLPFKNQLRVYFPNAEQFYEQKTVLNVEVFLPKIEAFRRVNEQYRINPYAKKYPKTGLETLVEYLDKEFIEYFKKFKRMLDEGKISYNFDTKIICYDVKRKSKVGSIVQESDYIRSFFNSRFVVNGTVITTNGKEFISHCSSFGIPYFKGVIEIVDLPFYPIQEDSPEYRYLFKRGKLYSEVGINCHYRDYKGNMSREGTFYKNEFRADGRCMIDSGLFIKNNPNYPNIFKETQQKFVNLGNYGGHVNRTKRFQVKKFSKLSEEQYFACPCHLFGFSFRLKKWGEFDLDNLASIKFNDDAFRSLVLEERKKNLIKSFVINNSKAVSDIIQNKGGGCIILLHGPPGTGKTLTAESKLLHRPLYSCSIGELGTDVNQLEKSLGDILEICKVWNAVILIDEADIFLEERSKSDIVRNAMVGVFLRLLEYHDGVLFLTTNRDKAFQSRISIAFKYEKLGINERKLVWGNLLNFFNFDYSGIKLDKLSEYDLNGRQIRTVIKLASALSNEKNKTNNKFKIFEKDVIECIECVNQFDLENDKVV